MTLVRAPQLGIERFATDRDREVRTNASAEDKDTILRAVYRQVLGQQHLMASERLLGAESLFRDGCLSVRELVRTIARSLYRAKFFENCNAYRFIELNHKHLLGPAPHNREEMLHHFTILQEQGVDAEIDSYIDSAEYQRRFGENTVPYLHGWDYAVGHEGRQFSWLMQLARGAAARPCGYRRATVPPASGSPPSRSPGWPPTPGCAAVRWCCGCP
jgi:phycoerythrin-associated linker protein